MINYQEELKSVAKWYGFTNQSNQTVEECAELIHAIMKYKRIKMSHASIRAKALVLARENIIDKLADMEIMINQLVHLFECKDEVEKITELKIARQLDRMIKDVNYAHEGELNEYKDEVSIQLELHKRQNKSC